jgi:SAM-dependent methyltransferase
MATDTVDVHYGPDIPTEADLRLCGDVRGKRVLELGCGDARNLLAFAAQGAIGMGIEPSADRFDRARRRCDDAGVKVDLRHGDLADLAFVRADSVDLTVSAGALQNVDDLGRVFRQVHRVLKPNAAFVLSLPHPAYGLVDATDDPPLLVRRSWFEPGHRTVSEVFMGLVNSNFRVDRLLEPEPVASGPRSGEWSEVMRYLPRTLIVRARKEGI